MEKIIIEETQFEEILKGVSKSCSFDDYRPEFFGKWRRDDSIRIKRLDCRKGFCPVHDTAGRIGWVLYLADIYDGFEDSHKVITKEDIKTLFKDFYGVEVEDESGDDKY